MFARLWSLITNLTGRQRFEDTLSEELHFHLDVYADDLMRKGLSRPAAYRRARVHFGSVERVRDECRQATGLRWLDEVGQLQGVELSHNVLDLLGTSPALGRRFLPTETRANGPRVAMLSHALWVSRFGADRSVVGETVMVNDTGHTVVGVLPKTFRFVHMPPVTESSDILTPFQRDPARCVGMSQCYRVSVVGRLISQLLTEGVVLGVLGGMVGLVVAAIGTPLLIQRLSRVVDLPRQAAMTVDWRVVAFAMALSVVAGLVTGFIPAVRMPRLAAALLGRRGTSSPHGGGVLRGLAVAQVAGAFVLVVGAALLDAGGGSLLHIERGFRSDDVLAAQLLLTGPDYRERGDNLAFVARLTDRIRGLPGVESVGATSSVPLDGIDGSAPYRPIGSPISSDATPVGWFRGATPDYFATMGIEVLRGRNVRDTDTADAAPVLVINQAMARRDWPEMDPVGQRLLIGAREFRIVGVVSDVRNFGLDREETPVFYRPLTQGAASYTTMVVKTRTPAALGASAARVVGSVVGSGLRLAGVGLGTGIGAAAVTLPILNRLVAGPPRPSLVSVGLAGLAMALLVIIACALPAWRADAVEPREAMQ